MKRTAIYCGHCPGCTGTDVESADSLARTIEDRGDHLVDIYIDDRRITGRGKHAGWHRLMCDLDAIDQIILADAGDLPGRTVGDLLNILATLTAHGVAVVVPSHGIDTSTGPVAILDLIQVYRRAKLSQAIKTGQSRTSKRIGRPPIPMTVRRRIVDALAQGGGTRLTARRYNVSPASVVNIRRSMMTTVAEAA